MSDRVPRDLTEQEAAVLAAMLSVASQEYSVGRLRVTGTCKCGCPTIHFNDSPNARTLAEAGVRDSNDVVLLFVDEAGELSSLELVWVSDQPLPRCLRRLYWCQSRPGRSGRCRLTTLSATPIW